MSAELQKALSDAYDVCLNVRDFTSNVIASDGKENANKTDLELNKKSKSYVKWYVKTFKKTVTTPKRKKSLV